MRLLSRTEEIILATVWRLKDEAYGIEISNHINKNTGLNWKFGAIYSPLGRLVDNDYLKTFEGVPTPERGGRRKVYYQLTDKGIQALKELQNVHSAVWINMPSLEVNK